jgi:hypothetical protein
MISSVYFQSWSSAWTSDSSKLDLAKIDERIGVVNLAFVDPCMKEYKAGSFEGTGLQFSSDFNVVKGAISLLVGRGVKVMLSVGGGSYPFSAGVINVFGCVALARDLGCTGIDLDWEDGVSKGVWLGIIKSFSTACAESILLPRLMLSAAVWSTGAFDGVIGDKYRGMNQEGLMLGGGMLDWINIMAYDAGNDFSPKAAWDAYRKIYAGQMFLGLELGDQAWGGHVISVEEFQGDLTWLSTDAKAGVFVWALQKSSGSGVSMAQILDAMHQPNGNNLPWKFMICCPACKYNIKLNYFYLLSSQSRLFGWGSGRSWGRHFIRNCCVFVGRKV